MLRVVADLGNSRLKWGLVDETGRLTATIALAARRSEILARGVGKVERIRRRCRRAGPSRPSIRRSQTQLQLFLDNLGNATSTWFRSAADVRVAHELIEPETAGADRALAVAAAISMAPAGRPGVVISCGTAITVERISRHGIWQGGAIAPGLSVTARALHNQTAQLPLVELHQPPAALGRQHTPGASKPAFSGARWARSASC